MQRSGIRSAGAMVASAVLYGAAARLALLMAIPPGHTAAVWPAAGIALICVLRFGARVAPGIALASIVVNLGISFDAHTPPAAAGALAVVLGTGAALQAVIGAALIRRRVGFPCALVDERDILRFFVLGGPVACLTSATLGVTALALGRVVAPASIAANWWTWWIGDTIGVLVFAPLALLVLRPSHEVWRRRRLVVGLPLALGFSVMAMLFARARDWERAHLHTEFVGRATPVAAVVKSQISSYQDVVTSVASYLEASETVTRRAFTEFCEGAVRAHAGLLALSWDPVVSEAERPGYEARARADGVAGYTIRERDAQGHLRTAGSRSTYVPVFYIEPMSRNLTALGFDVASDPMRHRVLERASWTRRVAASERVELVQLAASPTGGVVLVAPVFDPSHDTGRLTGFAVAAFELRGLVEAALRETDHDGMTLTLIDASRDDVTLYATTPMADGVAREAFPLTFGDHRWRLEIAPTPDYLAAQQNGQAWVVLAGGLFFVGLLGVVLLMATGRAEQVRASEAKYRALYEDSPDMCMTTEAAGGTIVDCNATLCRRLGYERSELIGQNFLMVYPPAYLASAAEREAAFQAVGEFVDVERQLRTKAGETIEVSLNLRGIRGPNGALVARRAVWRDISARQRDRRFFVHLGETLRSSTQVEDLLAAVAVDLGRFLGVTWCAFAELDPGGDRVTIRGEYHAGVPTLPGQLALSALDAGLGAAAAAGTTLVIGDTAGDARTSVGRQALEDIGVRALVAVPLHRDGASVVSLVTSFDRPRIWDEREISLIEHVAERVLTWVEHLHVLNQLRAQAVAAAIEHTEQRFRTLVEHVHEYALFMVDGEGRVATWNRGAERLLGYTAPQILGKDIAVFHGPDVASTENLARARETGHVEEEGWRVRQDGSRFWANVVFTAIFDQAGRFEGFAKVMRDFTDRRLREDQLRRSVKEREVLLQEVHHRVKNNLQVISSLINIQARRLDKGETRDAIEETRSRVHAIALIHEQLYQSKDYAEVRFAEYARSLTQSAFHAGRMSAHDVRLDLAIDEIPLAIDRAIPCGLVINELISNALKHGVNEGGGTVRVELVRVAPDKLRLTVADDGVGLPDGFDPRRSQSMGLQLVSTLARQIDAVLEWHSDHGASFSLTFQASA